MYSLNHKTPTTEGGAERPSGEISSSVKKVQRLVLYPNGRGATGFVPPNEATNANKKAPQHNSPPRKPFHNGTTLTPIPHPADPAFSTFLHEIQDKLETMHTDIKRLRDVSPSAESKKKHGSPQAHEKHEKQPVPPPGKPRKPTITSNASSGKFRLTSQSLNGSRSALLSDAARETKRSDSQGAGSQFSLNVETLDSPNASGSSSGSSSTSSSPTSGEAEVAKKAASPTTNNNNNTAAAAILPPVPSIVNKMGASLVPNAPKAAAPADGRTGFGFTGIISPTASPKGARVRGVALVNSPPPGSPPAAKPILDTAAAAGHADPSADDVKPMICDDRGVGDGARAVDGLTTDSRRLVEEAKKARMAFFSAFPRLSDVVSEEALKNPNYMDDVALPGAPCSWLCCMALAISYVTGVPTTIEKILRTNRLGIHFIALPAVTLAELYDHTNDYIHTCFHKSQGGEDDAQAVYGTAAGEFEEDEDAARCLKSGELSELVNTHCEMATFHSQVACDGVDDDAVLGMGEHVPIASLADFRKELATCAGETKSIYIFNYDPYIIEEHEVRMRSNMAETEEEAAQIMATMRYQPRSKGSFGILLDFNPVQHVAKILTPHLTSAQYPLRTTAENATLVQRFGSVYEHLVLEVHTISMQTLYESVTQIDPYSRLPRGFVRVFNNVAFINKPPSVFPLFVVDGSSSGGLTTSVLDVTIAPHILGLAMLHHLAVTFLLSDNARRKQSSRNLLSRANVCDVKLRGIPLTKICQQLGLPISMIVGDSKRSSLATVFVWYYIFLQQLQINQDVRLGLILAQRRDGSSDGMPNISEEEFLAHLQLAISTGSVMLLSFDINLATNCTISNKAEPAHFAILIGLNEESGIVRLADVNVKRFRKNWHVPISRLYNATMGYGYMMAARDKKTISALKGKAFQDEVLHCAKYFLPPQTNMIQRFEYPTDAYAITVLADAMEQLGLRSTVERLLNYSGFHISFFLSKHLPLEGAAIVAQNYSHHAVEDQLSVVVTHYDYHAENPAPGEEDPENPINMKHRMRTVEDLEKDVRYALDRPDERKLVLKYDREVLMAEPSVFNGSDGGSYAIVLEYSESTRIVKLMDCNPCSFYRVFACPLELMFRALCSYDQQDLRARGSLFLTKEYGQEANYENTKGYDMAHCQVHHPFKPIFSAWCSCIALAATEMMMNIETPLLLCGAPLGVEEDQRKKYRRYNNVFSAEDILYTTGEFSVHEWRTRALLGENMVHFTNAAFSKLRLPLVAMDMLERHPEARKDPAKLLEACGGISGLLTITIVLYDTDVLHGVPGSSAGVVNRVEEFGEHALNRTYNASHDHSEENSLDCSRSDSRRQMMQLHQNSVGSVQLVEGNPCCWGQFVDRTVEELMPAIISIICIHEFSEEDQVVL